MTPGACAEVRLPSFARTACLSALQAMWAVARWYAQFGLMAGTAFREVLADLRAEELHAEADAVEGARCSVMLTSSSR